MIYVALALFLPLQTPEAIPRAAESRPVNPYPAYVWRNGGPKANAAWAAAIQELGFSGTNVEGAEDPEPLAKLGLDFYVDHLVPREMLHRDSQDPVWKAAFDGYYEKRGRESLTRKPSLCDFRILDQILTFTEARASRARRWGARFVSVTDEPSYTSWLTPLDFDQSPEALDLFRQGLRSKFQTIAQLNEAWNVNYAKFDAVPLWTTDEIRAREWAHGPPWNFAPWNEARAFSDTAFALALKVSLDAARPASSPDAPVPPAGFLGGQPPSAFGGYDWWQLLRLTPEVLEVYDIGAARDLVRAMAPAVKLVDTSFLAGATAPVPAEYAAARLSWLFARGGRSAIVWDNAALFLESDVKRPTNAATELGKRVKSLRTLAGALGNARPEFDSVAIVLSQPSVRAGWLLDSRRDGSTWPKRFASHEYEHSAMLASLESWFRVLEDLGYSPSALDLDDLAESLTRAEVPRAVVFPRCLALDERDIQAIRAYVNGGGTAIFEGRPGLFDASLRGGGPAGPLDDVWGLVKSPFTGFADENCEPEPQAPRTPGGLLILEPALASKGAPAGRQESFAVKGAVLLNVSLTEYRDARLDPASIAAAALRALLTPILASAVGPPALRAETAGLPLSIHRERQGESLFLLLSPNVRRRPAIAAALARAIPVKLTGTGSPPKSLAELRGGEERPVAFARQGNEWIAELTLDPFDLQCLRLTAAARAESRPGEK